MSKILAVLGSTGQQGGSVVRHVVNTPELAQSYKIRALTRDVNSAQAAKLAKDVEVVQVDVNNAASLTAALTGVHTLFLVNMPEFGPGALENELNKGKAIADVAVAAGVKYIIFSTLPATTEISGGKYTHLTPFDAKAGIEKYIRTLEVKSAFVSIAFFMQNFAVQPAVLGPMKTADGTFVMARNVPADTLSPWIDVEADLGKFVGVILAQPDQYEGKRLCVAQGRYTFTELVTALGKSLGQPIKYKQVTDDEFRAALPDFLADMFVDGQLSMAETGYFGPGEDKEIEWAAGLVGEHLTTLDEYLAAHPFTPRDA